MRFSAGEYSLHDNCILIKEAQSERCTSKRGERVAEVMKMLFYPSENDPF